MPDTPDTNWIMNKNAVKQLLSIQMSPSLIATSFNNSRTYSNDRINLPDSISTLIFTSFATLQSTALNDSVQAVLYDNERWSFTPVDEQYDPVGFARQAAEYLHNLDRQLIFAPAIDLIYVLAPPGNKDKYDAFLNLNIYGQAAPYVDAIEIQVQQLQGTSRYLPVLQDAVSQIRSASSSVKIFAGMSSDPLGRPVSGPQLVHDYHATKYMVDGYWLNIPVQSPQCPTCGDGNPNAARNFLKSISA